MKENSYQIFDLNINRVCEGIRCLEDYLYSNHAFSEKQKLQEKRHYLRLLSDALNYPSIYRLNQSLSIDDNKKNVHYSSTKMYLLANCKRIQEGLRVLEEISRLIDIDLTLKFKVLRLFFYNYENTIYRLFYLNLLKESVYVILDKKISYLKNNYLTVVELVKSGCSVIQYRNKYDCQMCKIKEIKEIISYVKKRDILFIINDDLKIAKKLNWPFVHLGQTDLAKNLDNLYLEKLIILGISASNENEIKKAIQFPCNYIGYGAIFPTTSKKNVQYIDDYQESVKIYHKYITIIPIVLVGGINRNNIEELVCNFKPLFSVALISALVKDKDISKNFMFFNRKINY